MDMTNSKNGMMKSRMGSMDFTNRDNNGMASSNKSKAKDLTNAGYGAKAPRSAAIKTVMNSKPLTGVFKGSNPTMITPKKLDIPGFKKR